MRYKKYIEHNTRILFNTDLFDKVPVELFERRIIQRSTPPGKLQRGTALFFEHNNIPMVLKHYHRGGWLSRLITDTYSRYTLPPRQAPRMWEEFRLLARLHELGLPVPEPVAARCLVTSALTYRGDLITRQICKTQTLSDRLLECALPEAQWKAIGHTIARFHANLVCHADLNARNILLDPGGRTYLIDFDKCDIRPPDASMQWKPANLQRLLRSLCKIRKRYPELNFRDADWEHLLHGYHQFSAQPVYNLKAEQQFF